MKFDHRSFGGKHFRPKPEVYHDKNSGLLLVITPWGSRAAAKKAIQLISDYVLSSHDDPEITSPFSTLSCMSPMANNLRVAIMLTNDTLYYEDNKNEYCTGLEIFALAREKNEISWAQVGHPSIYLDRPNMSLQPIGNHFDVALNFSSEKAMDPLPTEFVGIYPTSKMAIQTVTIHPGDSLVLLSRASVPGQLFNSKAPKSLELITNVLVDDNSEEPFWVGHLNLN